MLNITEFLSVVLVALLTAVLAGVFLRRAQPQLQDRAGAVNDPVSLLFDDGILHHGTDAALRRFALLPGAHVWDDLRGALLPQFPDFPISAGAGASGSMRICASPADERCAIEIDWRDGLCWVHMSDLHPHISLEQNNSPSRTALALYCDTSPHPAWQTGTDNKVIWHNAAFQNLLDSDGNAAEVVTNELPARTGPRRISLGDTNGSPDWFEVTSSSSEVGHMYHATRITPLVQAEEAQRVFVQTLAKTFAHLSIGLAIFDRRGQLSIFNPALVDLTGLQANFLAARPAMMSFFDALRENRRMPEPKNYKTWRQDIADVIAAASGGQYRETWTLEDGRTYAVQGRPHPDGATAFLIEDISAEVTLSRSFRAEMEQFETVLDNIDDALVVFSAAGVVTFSNAAYRTMWGQNPDAAFADVTLSDAITLWSEKGQPEGGWQIVSDFSVHRDTGGTTSFAVALADGGGCHCTLSTLSADATLVRFAQPNVTNPQGALARRRETG